MQYLDLLILKVHGIGLRVLVYENLKYTFFTRGGIWEFVIDTFNVRPTHEPLSSIFYSYQCVPSSNWDLAGFKHDVIGEKTVASSWIEKPTFWGLSLWCCSIDPLNVKVTDSRGEGVETDNEP